MSIARKQTGLTMIELMLVLALSAMIIILGLRQYQMLKEDKDIQQIQATVNLLFLGASQFYQMNCRGGTLDPSSGSPPNPSPLPITGAGGLISNNILGTNQWPPVITGLINANAGSSGYIVQFNLTTATRSNVAAIFAGWGLPTPAITLQTTGNIYLWRIQVAIALAPGLDPNVYKGRLGANCASTSSGSTVNPCTPTSSGTFLVWERLPSFGATMTGSPLWLSMPRIKQFNQLYTNDDMYAATNPNWGNAGTMAGNTANNYLCGE